MNLRTVTSPKLYNAFSNDQNARALILNLYFLCVALKNYKKLGLTFTDIKNATADYESTIRRFGQMLQDIFGSVFNVESTPVRRVEEAFEHLRNFMTKLASENSPAGLTLRTQFPDGFRVVMDKIPNERSVINALASFRDRWSAAKVEAQPTTACVEPAPAISAAEILRLAHERAIERVAQRLEADAMALA